MNGCERQWTLVVFVWLGVLTLFTVNGHPYLERNIGLGIDDDPAESNPLSLSERDAGEQPSDVPIQSQNDNKTNVTTSTALSTISPKKATTVSVNAKSVDATPSKNIILTQFSANKTNLATTASPLENVTIIAAATQAGNPGLTSILGSSVNIEINPSQTIQNVPKNSTRVNLATYTSSLKPSFTKAPTEISLSAHVSAPTNLSPSQSASINIKLPVNVSSAVIAVESSPVLKSSVKPILHSAAIANKPSAAPSTQVSPGASTKGQTDTPSSQSPTTVQTSSTQQSSQDASDVSSSQSTSVLPSTNKPSELPSSSSATDVPSTGSPSTQNTKVSTGTSTKPLIQTSPKVASTGIPSTGVPSTGVPSTLPSTGVASTVPSTGPESLPPTTEAKAPPQKDTGKPTTQASEEPTTKDSPAASTTKGSSTAPTTNAVPETANKVTTNAVPETTKKTTTNPLPETSKEPTTNAVPETTKKATTKALPETTKEATTNSVPETTKEVTTKAAAVTKEKATTEKTETKSQNNDEGRMPPPDQGREAVLWDFIVPVAIGTGVALAIALGVVFVRTCRRRKLVKVRFGGKPSHPRLLNNDLINLLAESDDEEE